MTLLAPLALLFSLAALVPLILHLYQRRNRTVILFSTNRFFTTAILRSQRRLRLQRWLLLLLRITACLLLAFALARPVLSVFGGSAGRPGERDLVILLDDSLSMQATAADATSRFDQARTLARAALDQLAPGDRAAIITLTGRQIGHATPTGVTPTSDHLHLIDELTTLAPTHAAGDAARALQAAIRALARDQRRAATLLAISDFQDSDWPRGDWPQPDHPAATALAPVAPPPRDNLTLAGAALSEPAAIVGQPNLLRVRIVNHGPTAATRDLIVARDDRELARRSITVPAFSPLVERIPINFEQPGPQRLQLSLAGRDALTADDHLYTTLTVSTQLPILIIDPDRGQPRTAAFYLQAACRAVSPAADGLPADVLRPDDLAAATLENYRVIILADIPDLPPEQLTRLEDFVKGGGGLLVCLGDHAHPDAVNAALAGPARPLGGLLPGQLRAQVGHTDTDEPRHLLAADLSHPVLQRFSGPLRGSLAAIDVHRAHVIHPRGAWIIATITGDIPWLLERTYGRGRVLLMTSIPTPRWTDLPLRPVFLPLVGRMVNYLAGGASTLESGTAGTPLAFPLQQYAPDDARYAVRPDGSRARLNIEVTPAGPLAILPADQVNTPGFYTLEAPGQAPATVAANAPRAESSPDARPLDDLATTSGRWQTFTLDTNSADPRATLATLFTGGSPGRGIWDALLWLALLLILLEPLIANRRTRDRAATAAAAPDQRRVA